MNGTARTPRRRSLAVHPKESRRVLPIQRPGLPLSSCLVEERVVDMGDPDQRHCGAIRKGNRRAAAVDGRRRDDMIDTVGILTLECDRIAMRLAEPDDGIVTFDAAVLDQCAAAPHGDQIVSRAAIDRVVAAAPGDCVVGVPADDQIRPGATVDQCAARPGVYRIRPATAKYRVVAIAAKNEIRAVPPMIKSPP